MASMTRSAVLGAAALMVGASMFLINVQQPVTAAPAVSSAAAQAGVPDLSGGYVRIDQSGSGSFGGLTRGFTQAELTPEAKAAPTGPGRGGQEVNDDVPLVIGKPNPAGVPYVVTAGRCGGPGAGIEFNSAAFFLLQSKNKIVIVREGAGSRHIYLDGRQKPDASRWIPTNAGFSNGRYENGDLVVETTGLTPGVVTAGGRRSVETKLTERFSLSPDRKKLTITYTWTDPKIYVRPHTYQMSFDKLPDTDYAFEGWCDASDPVSGQGITPPVQIQ